MNGDISILGPCVCGGGPTEPNYECERCRLVYFVQQVSLMRAAQVAYFRDRNSLNLDRARHLEGKIDTLVQRLTSRPEPSLFGDDDPAVSTYYQNGG